MFTYSRPSSRRFEKRATTVMAKQSKTEAWLLKIGQTIFVGATVIGFVLLFQGK
jgi:hypothetical protein